LFIFFMPGTRLNEHLQFHRDSGGADSEARMNEEAALNEANTAPKPITSPDGSIAKSPEEEHLKLPPLETSDVSNDAPSSGGRSALRYVFFGAEGLRAGWGLLIFIAMIVGSFYSVHLIRAAIERHHSAAATSQVTEGNPAQANPGSGATSQAAEEASKPLPPRAAFLREGPYFLIVMLATFIMSRIERRPFGVFGLGGTHRLPQFFTGLFWGVVCLSLLVCLLRLLGYLQFDALLLRGGAALRYGVLWAIGFLLVALLEETLLRGYAQYTLARGFAGIYGAIFKNTRHRHALGFWTAALVLSFVFGIGHSANPGESPIGLLGAGLVGLVFCFALYRTGSLWWAIGLHAAWDWSQSFLYGVADSGVMAQGHLFTTHPVGKPILSGGLTGPEGSIFAILMLVVIAGIISITLRPTHDPRAKDVNV
jgi:membrane protease YdiL (CAAX protease family)